MCLKGKSLPHLLRLLGSLDGLEFSVAALLVSFRAGFSVHEVVPPSEAASVVANELLVVHIVMFGARPDGQDVTQAPGKVVAAVGIDGLEKTKDDPGVHGNQMQVSRDAEKHNGRAHSAHAKEHGLDGRSVLSGQSEGRRVSVVHLVDCLVQRAVVQASMEPVVPGIFHHKEDGDLNGHLEEGGERHSIGHAEVGGERVEQPDLWQLGGEMANQDDGSAIPLLLECGNLLVLDLILVKVRNLVHDEERKAAAEVDDFMHDKAHDSGRQGIVLHEEVPSLS